MESRRGFYSNNSNSNSSSNILLSRSSSNYSGDGRKYTGNKSNQKYSSKVMPRSNLAGDIMNVN